MSKQADGFDSYHLCSSKTPENYENSEIRLRHFKVEVRREFPHVGRYPEIPKFPHPAL